MCKRTMESILHFLGTIIDTLLFMLSAKVFPFAWHVSLQTLFDSFFPLTNLHPGKKLLLVFISAQIGWSPCSSHNAACNYRFSAHYMDIKHATRGDRYYGP
jgi:hypothetical protein